MMAGQPAKVHRYKDIDYSLKQSERKTSSIYIERDGSVSLLVPNTFDQGMIEQLLEKKRRWIYQNLAEWQDLNRTRVTREYVNGESFLYCGSNYRLKLIPQQNAEQNGQQNAEQSQPLLLKQGYFCLLASAVDSAPAHFIAFYQAKLQKRLKPLMAQYSAQMGVDYSGFKVVTLKNRWGSCSAKGRLSFHWQCAMLPLSVLDYIVVHELAHIEHLDHSDAFWRCVEKVLPDYQTQKTWLKFNGAKLGV